MSEIKYGLISQTDARTLEKTIDLICDEFPNGAINITEIGIFDGQTARGLFEYTSHKRGCNYTAIDNNKDKEVFKPFDGCYLIIGDSNEVYNQLFNNSQQLIFIDADHSYIGIISDFYAYCDKVKVGGYMAFHDTGKHIKQFKDFQHGDKNNPDAYISVRKALRAIGLFGNWVTPPSQAAIYYPPTYKGWQLIFDEADETDEAGGICVFKKLY